MSVKKHKLCKRLSELREENDWNKSKAATKIGIPKTSYISYENGVYEPDIDRLIQIANFYNVSVDYLIGNIYTKKDYKIPETISTYKEAIDFVENMKTILKDKSEQEIIRLVQAILFLVNK